MRIKFKLNPYFNTYRYMSYFYDAEIKKLNITKKDFLTNLNISYSSYNRSIYKDAPVSEEIFTRLEEYFNINRLDDSKIPFYNNILTDTIIKIYYKQKGKDDLKNRIEEAINDNNYLRPIFELLLALYTLSNIDSLQNLSDKYNETYNNLIDYEDLFCLYPTKELFIYLSLLTYNKNKLIGIQNIEMAYDFYGMIYNAVALNAFYNERYDLCLYYSNEAYKALLRMCNYRRIIILNIVFYAALNVIGEYNRAKIESEHQLIYLSDLNIEDDIVETTKTQYYNSLLGLKDYDEIVDYYNDLDRKYSIDHIYYLIALALIDKDEFKLKHDILLDKIDSKYRNEYLIVAEYLMENNPSTYKSLASSRINKFLKRILLK